MRILSYNIHKGIGGVDRRYRLERVLQVFERKAPDIICLQEVDRHVKRSRHDDQPQLIAEAFAAVSHCYQLNVSIQRGGYGNLIISRWPIVREHAISLQLRNRKPRGAQMAVIDSPQGALHLVNWHLGLVENERHWQVGRLLAHHLFHESSELPTLIIGDTNDWRNRLTATLSQHGFVQATSPPSRFRSFPAYLSVASLDKAFFRGGVHLSRATVPRYALAQQASDHLPLVIDIDLVKSASNGSPDGFPDGDAPANGSP